MLVQANARSERAYMRTTRRSIRSTRAQAVRLAEVRAAAHVATVPVLDVAGDVTLDADLRARGLALKVSEIRAIARELGRDPTIVEAHAFDAQWSEHCSYKSSRHYLTRLPVDGPTVMQGPQEDAGIVHLGTWAGVRYGVVIAHESHNHPSQVVPFEGAATGIGGIVRDVLCMGARLIAIADPLRFGPRDDSHCRYVAQGVVDGIAAYGNAIGVPNIAGDVYFNDGFRDNCLVNVVALGLVAQDDIIHSCAPPDAEGWDIVLVGKATDRSGFGGAAFSSLVLDDDDAEQNRGAVQVPDPFLKNVVMRASYRVFDVLRERGLTVGFKDLGAGGIMGCTAEIVASGGFGAIVDLDRCPTSQEGLPPAVIAVGETQERLTWVVPPSFTADLLAIYNEEFSLPQIARGACAAVIGTVTKDRRYVLRHDGATVMDVAIDLLTGGIRYDRPTSPPPVAAAADDMAAHGGRAALRRGRIRTLSDDARTRARASRRVLAPADLRTLRFGRARPHVVAVRLCRCGRARADRRRAARGRARARRQSSPRRARRHARGGGRRRRRDPQRRRRRRARGGHDRLSQFRKPRSARPDGRIRRERRWPGACGTRTRRAVRLGQRQPL